MLFQSTPLREGRPDSGGTSDSVTVFQSTPLREGRQGLTLQEISSTSFNPRPYVRGDLRIGKGGFDAITFQSTPLREGRQRHHRKAVEHLDVSIHAPT